MTKYWTSGQAKTRLGASIGMDQAAELHRLFVSHLCSSLSGVADENVVCLAPDSSLQSFSSELGRWGLNDLWNTCPQGAGDLGERMQRWFAQFLGDHLSSESRGQEKMRLAILIGADCPTLAADQIRQTADLLRTRDVVLGPAADGGYYLVGLRGPWLQRAPGYSLLFQDIPWSTPDVLSITRRRAAAAGLKLAELCTLEDIDTVAELGRLRAALSSDRTLGSDESLMKLKSGIDRIMADSPLHVCGNDSTRPGEAVSDERP